MEAHQPGTIVLRAEAVFHQAIPDLARGAILRNLFEEIVVRIEEETEARPEIVHIEAAAACPLDVFHAVVNRERQFLQRSRAGFPNVVSGDGNRVEARSELRSKLESVDHQPHRRRRRIDVFLLRDVFLEDVVLHRAGNFLPVRTLLFGHHQIHRPEHARGRVDGHRRRDFFQVDAVEENLHVFQRIDRHTALADFAFACRMVGVVAHQRRQIERDRESATTVFEQIFVALVGFFGRREAREHAHGPQLAAIAGGMNAARVRRLSGIAEVFVVVPISGKVGLRIETSNGNVGNSAEAGVAVFVEISTGGRADRFLGSLCQCRSQGFLGPCFLRSVWATIFKNVGNRAFRDRRLGAAGILFAVWHSAPRAKSDHRGGLRRPQDYEPTERLGRVRAKARVETRLQRRCRR